MNLSQPFLQARTRSTGEISTEITTTTLGKSWGNVDRDAIIVHRERVGLEKWGESRSSAASLRTGPGSDVSSINEAPSLTEVFYQHPGFKAMG